MRSALAASLILAAGLSTAAQAQDPAPMQTAPAPAAAPPAAAPPAAAPMAQTPPAAPAAPAPAAEAPPTLPTTGDGAVLINLVEKVCVPLVRGGKFDDLAKAAGMKANRRDGTWSMPLSTEKGANRDYNVTIFAPGANKDVCRAEVHYMQGGDEAIVKAFNIWSFLHKPELILQANYVSVNADGVKRVQKSWEHLESNSSVAINFTTATKPDDSPLNPKWATAEFFYQERKLQ